MRLPVGDCWEHPLDRLTPTPAVPMSAEWTKGYEAAVEQAKGRTGPAGIDTFVNPFRSESDEWVGFEEARCDLTRRRR